MAINLMSIEPNKVSRDLSGYITYLFAPGGAGKTSFGAQMPSPLIIAFERGYSAIPGVIAQDVNSWGEFKQVVRELKKPEVKERFKTIILDTVDVGSQYLEKYMCSQLGIENIGDGGWSTNGWAKAKKEWEQTIRTIIAEGYALLFISHSKDKTFTRKNGTTYNQIVPSCSNAYNEIIRNMADLEAYIEVNEEAHTRRLILRSEDNSIECKSRFKYMEDSIPFGYQSLVDALNRAIDKEAAETNGQFVTNEKTNLATEKQYNFDEMMSNFQSLIGQIMEKNQNNALKITAIIEKYLGKGKKAGDCTPEQCEQLELILIDLQELLKNL